MSAIYDFFYNLIEQTLPAINESMAIGMASTFTFIMLGLLFAIFPIMIARMLNSKNLVKMYWIVVIVMAMALFFVNNFPNIFHVGDTVITQEASKNYNGYFNIQDEDAIRLYANQYYMPFENYYEYYYSLTYVQNEQSFHIRFNIPYIVYSTYGDYNMAIMVSQIYSEFYDDYKLVINYIDGTSTITSINNGEDDQIVNIYGISNYEVQP